MQNRIFVGVMLLISVNLFSALIYQSSGYRLKIHVLRANIGALEALCLVMGLIVLPLATVSSLYYSAPLMIMLLGYVLINPGQWLCAILEFIGILIILRPGEMSLAVYWYCSVP
ncbi:MAG: hypothetical protein LPH21_13690 [Shewanella sp.]|nr:hypothetical protein [Shewanella sp.]